LGLTNPEHDVVELSDKLGINKGARYSRVPRLSVPVTQQTVERD